MVRTFCLAVVAFLLAGCAEPAGSTANVPASGVGVPEPVTPDPHSLGGACADCHAAETAAWARSHHAAAQTTTVDASRFDGTTRRVGNLSVTPRADGPEGPRFVVKDGAGTSVYAAVGTIGVFPLQQYLLEGKRGRRLISPIAFDVNRAAWFDPSPDGAEGDPDDPLYWAGMAGTWNHQCAACHTTQFTKGYEPKTDTYQSTALNDGVGCVACHGPTESPRSLRTAAAQLDVCAGCHSLRRALTCADTGEGPFLDRYRPALADSGAFGADGRPSAQIEPFEWGLWAQSKMAASHVRCTDCHHPHGGAAPPGDGNCQSCHASPSDIAEHRPRTGCVDCHMPTTLYMGIHARHDHGIRRPNDARHAEVVRAALANAPSDASALLLLAAHDQATAFERASAVALARRFPPTAETFAHLRALATNHDALIRTETIATLGVWGDSATAERALADPVRAVRFAAIEAFVAAGGNAAQAQPAFGLVLREVEQLGACDDDLPGTHQDLGRLRAAAGDREGAVKAFETLLLTDPQNPIGTRALKLLERPPIR